MTTKQKYIVISVLMITAFAFGRYSVPASSVTEEKHKEETHTDKKEDKHVTTVIVEKPTGEKITTITEDTKTHTDTDSIIVTDKKEKIFKKQVVNVSALAGISTTGRHNPVYGISVSKEFVGPITIGAYGMDNGIIGVSVGLNF